MGKVQLYYSGKIRHELNPKTGKEIEVYETEYREKQRPCKTCKKNPRKANSSRCEECVAKYLMQKSDDDRLKKKIARQSNIKS